MTRSGILTWFNRIHSAWMFICPILLLKLTIFYHCGGESECRYLVLIIHTMGKFILELNSICISESDVAPYGFIENSLIQYCNKSDIASRWFYSREYNVKINELKEKFAFTFPLIYRNLQLLVAMMPIFISSEMGLVFTMLLFHTW